MQWYISLTESILFCIMAVHFSLNVSHHQADCKKKYLYLWESITFISRLMHSNIQNLEVKIYVV